MEIQIEKCSLDNHKDKDATSYCAKCENYMCKKCELFHSEFFKSKHKIYIFDNKNFENIKNYKDIKEFDNINNEQDIKYLKEFSNKLKDINENLNNELEKINIIKEELITKLQKYFTKLRNELNVVEDKILLEIDKQYEKLELNKKLKQNDLILRKIKLSLDKKNMKLDSLINECRNIKNEDIKNEELKMDILIPEEPEIDEICEKIRNLNKFRESFFNSSIIKNNLKMENLINDWIKEKMEKNVLQYELIYKMSENGSSPKNFHKYCDNKGSTLTIIKTSSNRIFGGFTPLSWNNRGSQYDKSKKSFLFSMNLLKKYNMINADKVAIYCNEDYGPTFGGNDIYFCNDLSYGKSFAEEGSTFLSNYNLELTGGRGKKEGFDTIDIEVFKII
jgi:hypothetical protein